MQRVTRATSIAAVAVVTTSMLMQTASAVEVTTWSAPDETSGPVAPAEVVSPPPPSSPNCFILGSRSFSIPFSVDTAGTRPVEVHLFVARGPNQDWQLLDRKSPDSPQKQFQFQADSDGEFWFATRTIDTLGRSHPDGEIESQLKVYVDTTKPQVNLHADADADGHVDVNLSVQDATQLKELQLRYVTDTTKTWVNVDLGDLSADGRLQFVPSDADSWKQLSVQLVVTDTPGNRSVVNQLLRRPRLAEADTNRYAASQERGGIEARALPYRIDSSDQTSAYTVSNPVIQLDRHRVRPPSEVTTAHGYAADALPQKTTPFYGFRGASAPLPSATAIGAGSIGVGTAPQLLAAPQPGVSPQAAGPTTASSSAAGAAYAADAAIAANPATVPAYSVPFQVQSGTTSGGLPQYGVVPQQGAPGTPTPASAAFGKAAPGNAAFGSPAPTAGPALGESATAASPVPSYARSQTSAVPSGAADPTAGPTTPRPASLFEKLFGTAPSTPYPTSPGQSPAGSGQATTWGQSGPSSGMTFAPPSVREGRVRSRLAATGQEGLPPMATPDEISEGFELNSPNMNSTLPSASGPQPETIPVPSDPEPSSPPQGSAPQRPRPRTPAEAMKPIDEPSEVSSLLQEEVPAPTGEPDPYQSRRAAPGPDPGGPLRSEVANMMDRAPVRYSDSLRFSLEYELEAVGIQGTEAIELYGSTDGGRRWELWGRDPDRTSPFDIETKEAGVFGFRIVVVGRNGLASPRPQSGEAPDIVVVVDTERPSVRITGASYGEGDRVGALIIQYECDDRNLKSRPIALSFSDSLEGPWTTIAAGLRNDGQYIWKPDPHLPRQFYLRIDATDEAGNTGAYVLDQPIDSQGLAPRARIRGFQTISGDLWNPSDSGPTATRPKATFK